MTFNSHNCLHEDYLYLWSVAIPALRVLRIFRVFRILRAACAARGLRLLRMIISFKRGMKALSRSLSRRGFGYVIALSIIVAFAGATCMFAFENEMPDGLKTYGDTLYSSTYFF